MQKLIFFLCLALIFQAYAEGDKLFSLNFGPVNIGENRIPIDLRDFKVKVKSKEGIQALFLKDSVQWVRTHNNLLTPRARLGIIISDKEKSHHIKHQGFIILPEKRSKHLYAELYVSLFSPSKIEIMQGEHKVANIAIYATPPKKKGETQLIDYSCARYDLEFQGLDEEYLSVGCRLEPTGKFGSELPRLEVTWSTTNFLLEDGAEPPYISILTGSNPVNVTVIDKLGTKKQVTIKAKLPKRMHRLKTALGFGPYMFRSKQGNQVRGDRVAPAAMIYANFRLTPSTSIRAFDAFMYQETIFNNFGFYFAYEIADAFDGRFELVPLLGIQGLSFRYNSGDGFYSKVIYPQGFEAVFKHVFGIKNYTVVYGMFISPTSTEDYKNLWIRWGKRYFWELNYIDWRTPYEGKLASMWGLSVGIPFLSFF